MITCSPINATKRESLKFDADNLQINVNGYIVLVETEIYVLTIHEVGRFLRK